MIRHFKPRFPYPYPEPFLVSVAALDLENYADGRSNDLDNVQRLAEILWENQLEDNYQFGMNMRIQFYEPLLNAMRENSDKEIKNNSELALEMRLLRSELEHPNMKQIDGNIVPFLCAYSTELSRAYDKNQYKYSMVA